MPIKQGHLLFVADCVATPNMTLPADPAFLGLLQVNMALHFL